ncbi:hypothetical protein PtA15_11A229 [Puccinia triticina]|uniref:Uncharacterized protein n=1 Tax=Puccinia triticina TaxID=208348 RepID=A0ABY7D0H9_9BASI|nr:uncharacterized protein PtA15_11A229 [Puccinia triticina]WAQ89540.1 hypothetical protein PtA15_11A229 [Puccinia triticina]
MLEDPQLVILVRSLAPPPLAPDSQILQEQLQVGSESKRNYFGVEILCFTFILSIC